MRSDVVWGSRLALLNRWFTMLNWLFRQSKDASRAQQKSSGYSARCLQKSAPRLCKVFHSIEPLCIFLGTLLSRRPSRVRRIL